MACYFLCENNSLSKKALSRPLPQTFASKIEVPLKKLRKRHEVKFKSKLENSNAFIFGEPKLSYLIPEREIDEQGFFDSVILRAISEKSRAMNLTFKRAVIFNPTLELAREALNIFDNLALFGDNAITVSNSLYELLGAAVPIVSGTDSYDLVLSCRDIPITPFGFLAGYKVKTQKTSLGGDGIFFYPKGQYMILSSLAGRPLSLKEAALLQNFDKKASFNIAF